MTDSNVREIDKDYEYKIQISSDYYEAYLSFEMYNKSYKFTKEEIIEILQTKNINFGIDFSVVKAIVENPTSQSNFLIAKGIPHENGKNGKITYFFDTSQKIKPTLLENGRVDFKHMNFVQKIVVGDVLAERTMPTEGRNGTTITGKVIKARPGKIVNFKFGKNVEISEDGLKLLAQVDGTISFINEKVEVIKVLYVEGDVGIKTGNIEFSGKVVVNGNLTTGYKIICDEDLEINGIVESSGIECKGNVTISIGIQGNDNANIFCEGDLMCGFMNNCRVRVLGDIKSGSVMHSDIVCDGKLEVKGKKGLIIGGNIQVRREINAKVIGSEMGTITYLKMGIDSNIMDEYNKLVLDIKEHKQGIVKLEQAVNILKKQSESDPSNCEVMEMLEKTVSSKQKYQEEFKAISLRFQELNETINKLKGSQVVVDTIYPGSKIKIGNTFYNVKSPLNRVIIKKDGGEIFVVSK